MVMTAVRAKRSADQDFAFAANHRDRAILATSVNHRYSGDEDFPRDIANAELLNKDDEERALQIGLAARFAFALTASAPGVLPHYRLRMTPAKIILEVPRRQEAIAGEPVQKRLGALAAAFGRKGEILIGCPLGANGRHHHILSGIERLNPGYWLAYLAFAAPTAL